MKFRKQVFALGGIALFGSMVIPADQAFAFGQQWRPAPGFVSSQAQGYQRVANVPTFRPRASSSASLQMPGYRPQPRRPSYPRRAASHGYAMAPQPRSAAQPLSAYPPGYQQPRFAAPVWTQPFGGMAQMWQAPVRVFGRQFAWQAPERTSMQPWMAAEPAQRRAETRVWAAPRSAAYHRPAMAGRAPMGGSWRPATFPRDAAHTAVYPSHAQPAARPAPPTVHYVRGNGGRFTQAAADFRQWRPTGSLAGTVRQPQYSFRPATYGRNLTGDARIAARGAAAVSGAGDALPGFVTTYRHGDAGYACTWCGGS